MGLPALANATRPLKTHSDLPQYRKFHCVHQEPDGSQVQPDDLGCSFDHDGFVIP